MTNKPRDMRNISLQWLVVFARADSDTEAEKHWSEILEQEYPGTLSKAAARNAK